MDERKVNVMIKNKRFNLAVLALSLLTLQSGCSQGSSAAIEESTSFNSLSNQLSKVSFKAMSQDGSNLVASDEQAIVHVSELEVLIAGSEKSAKVILKKDLGAIDLMKLNQGMMLDLMSLNLSSGTEIKEIRLRLNNTGNYYVNNNGERCDLQTPSAQQSGLKLKLPSAMRVESGYSYNIVMGFDPKKSIVLQGHGGCLLKPVIRIENLTRVANDDSSNEEPLPVDEENTEQSPVEEPPVDNPDSEDPVEGIDYIIDGNTILIPQEDGNFLVIEGVDLTQVSIKEILASLEQMN